MRSYSFVTVDVFTDVRFGGNPLAVFPDAQGLSDGEMQALATEFNLSETTFVLPPEDPAHSARVRIFNTSYEMAFAGHPNVGTGYVLAQMDRDVEGVLVFEEMAGLVRVRVERDADGSVIGATIDAPLPLSTGQQFDATAVAACAGLGAGDIVAASHAPVEASMGNPFVIAEVTPGALSRAVPDAAAFRSLLADSPGMNGRLALYLYAHEGGGIRARMFAPLSGTAEDPATGSAATPLAGLLLSLGGESVAEYRIQQGVEMGRPSLLLASARRTPDGVRASVGGGCVPVLRGEVTL